MQAPCPWLDIYPMNCLGYWASWVALRIHAASQGPDTQWKYLSNWKATSTQALAPGKSETEAGGPGMEGALAAYGGDSPRVNTELQYGMGNVAQSVGAPQKPLA